ncbi:MAG: galactokinase, partial [Planctomycetota bacterium]
LDIIETPDLARQLIADKINEKISKGLKITPAQIKKIINSHLHSPKKQALALPELIKLTGNGKSIKISELKKNLNLPKYNLEVNGRKYTGKQIENRCKGVNPSLYMFNTDAFYQGVEMIDNNNAQSEYYLTDVVKHLSSIKDTAGNNKFRVRAVPANDPNLVQGFNSPDELLAIQDYIRQKKDKKQQSTASAVRPHLKTNQYCTVQHWLNKISNQKPTLKKWLNQIYGRYDFLHQQKCDELTKVLNCYGRQFGFDQKVCIIRAPGRINLMGRHVDHRGGFNNFMAINRETIAVAGLRKDNNVIAVNTQPKKFKTVQFNITDLIGRFAWSDWINFVNSNWVRNMLYSSAGNWGNYIKAAALRLQHKFQDIKIKGINLAVTGNVPIAAGLSSSSTIVVATLQAAIALNNFELTSQQFIDLCGEGEWFVGSRGGAGDHAAIYLGQRGKIAQVGYLPFRVEKIIDAPKDYQVIIADSHIKAPKSSSAKEKFNAKIASCNLGLALLKHRCPQIKDSIDYIRDINPEKLGCTTSHIYRMLLKIPESISQKEFREILSKEHEQLLQTNFATHSPPPCYNVRLVLLFGAAEITRSKICIDLLESGRINEFGCLMKISHNGDRVSTPSSNGTYQLTNQSCSDDYLNKLITDLAGEDPKKVLNAQLYMQPGGYGCSTPQIDRMVDIACSVPGVKGAQIAGAGLGGCIMVLTEKNCVDNIQKALIKHYYKPNKLKPAMIPCTTVEGAGIVEF